MISFLALAQSRTHTHLMLRYYVMISSLALAHRRDATLWFLLLHLHNLAHIHTHWMLRYDIFSFTCTISCTNTHTHVMLDYDIFSCTCTISHTHLMLLYDFLPCTCTILRAHTHIHTHIWCYDMISSFGQNLPMDFQAQFGKAATDQQHEKRMENVQIKQFIVKWSKHIIYEMAKSEAFSYVFVHWSQKRRGEPCYHVFGVPTSLPFATPGSRKCFIR